MSQTGIINIQGGGGGGSPLTTLSSEGGAPVPPVANNFNFSGSLAGGAAANGAILFNTSGAGEMDAAVQVDGTTIIINASNQLQATDTGIIATIDGDTGSITGSTVKIYADQATANCGSTVSFVNSGTTSTLNVSNSFLRNTIIGYNAGNSAITGGYTLGVGYLALNALTSGNANTAVGCQALAFLTTGSGNVAVGLGSQQENISGSLNVSVGQSALTHLTSGVENTAIGDEALASLVTGNINTALGKDAGSEYSGGESQNIVIGNIGVASESSVIRIGTQIYEGVGQDITYIAGITGATPVSANTPQVVLCDNTGNLTTISSSSSGFVLTSNGSSTPSFQSLPSSLTPWTDESGPYTAVSNAGYFLVGAATPLLPASPNQGDYVKFICDTSSLVTVTANTGQFIRLGTTITAAAGTAACSNQGNTLSLWYHAAATSWIAECSIGTWTLT